MRNTESLPPHCQHLCHQPDFPLALGHETLSLAPRLVRFFSQPHPVTVSRSCLNMKPLTAPPTRHPQQALQALFLEAVILSADVLM